MPERVGDERRIIIIGSGFSGLCVGIQLLEVHRLVGAHSTNRLVALVSEELAKPERR